MNTVTIHQIFHPDIVPIIQLVVRNFRDMDEGVLLPRIEKEVIENVLLAVSPEDIAKIKTSRGLNIIIAIAAGMLLASVEQVAKVIEEDEVKRARRN